MIFSFYQLTFFFLIYALIGWCVEVVYAAVDSGKFVNRGFLNGPYCPIYGIGVVIVVICLYPIKENPGILFIGSVGLTTLLELVTGYLLERIFNEKWWDYSDENFNFKGYICVKFSIMWGLACIIVVRVIHPLILNLVNFIPHFVGVIIISLFAAGIISDMIITLLGIMHIKKSIRLLNSISSEMRNISDFAGEKLYDGVNIIKEQNEKYKEKLDAQRNEYNAKIEELKQRYNKLNQKKGFVYKRIENAFPKLKLSHRMNIKDMLEKLEQHKKGE